jgi:hypothetical protein
MLEYNNLNDRDELVAQARQSKERIDVSTQDERDALLRDLLVRTHPSRESQLGCARRPVRTRAAAPTRERDVGATGTPSAWVRQAAREDGGVRSS